MQINRVFGNTQSFGARAPKDIEKLIKYRFDTALSRGVIFPGVIRKTAANLHNRFPEYEDFIFRNRESTDFLLPMFKEEAKKLPLIKRLWTYLVQVPNEIKRNYFN